MPGCATSLQAEGPYSRKSKACKQHRLSLAVEIGDKLMRFCQQCSRFEDVGSFDGQNR